MAYRRPPHADGRSVLAPTATVDRWMHDGEAALMLFAGLRTQIGRTEPHGFNETRAGDGANDIIGYVEVNLREMLRSRAFYSPHRSALKEAILDLMGRVEAGRGPEQLRRAIATAREDGLQWMSKLDNEGDQEFIDEIVTDVTGDSRGSLMGEWGYLQDLEEIEEQQEDEENREISYDLADHPSEDEDEDEEDEDLSIAAAAPVRTPSVEVHYSRLLSDAQELVRRIREAGPGNFPTEFMREQQERRRQELPRRINRTAQPTMEDFESQLNGRINMRGSVAEEEALRRGAATSSSSSSQRSQPPSPPQPSS